MSRSKTGGNRVKTVVMVGALAAIVAGAAAFGPELIAYRKFSAAAAAVSGRNGNWGITTPPVVGMCLTCHGHNGNVVSQTYPRLAGQPAAYLENQLAAFASGDRSNPTMAAVSRNLSADEVKAAAGFFAAQAASPNSAFVQDAAAAERGSKKVQASNCAACHGPAFAGRDQYPRLAGQGYNYLVGQLSRYKLHQRSDDDGVMERIAAGLSEQDIDDMSQFLAKQ